MKRETTECDTSGVEGNWRLRDSAANNVSRGATRRRINYGGVNNQAGSDSPWRMSGGGLDDGGLRDTRERTNERMNRNVRVGESGNGNGRRASGRVDWLGKNNGSGNRGRGLYVGGLKQYNDRHSGNNFERLCLPFLQNLIYISLIMSS